MVEGSIPGLAHLAGITISECEAALAILQQPDQYSRSPEHQGRRIDTVPGGWLVLNRTKYRDLIPDEQRRERNRLRQQRHRLSRVTWCDSHALSQSVTPGRGRGIGIGKDKSRAGGAKAPRTRATQMPEDFQPKESHKVLAAELGVDLSAAFAGFVDHHGSKGSTYKNWDLALNTWLRKELKFAKGNGNRARIRPVEELYAE